VKDKSFKAIKPVNRKAVADHEIGAPLQGKLSKILVKAGDAVQKNTPLFVIEAMKMESTIVAPYAGVVKNIVLKEGVFVAQEDLVVEL
jgi:pyruvate carboxylase